VQPQEANDDEITYIRDLLSGLADMAKERGDRTLTHLIAMAWLHAWEVERRIKDQVVEHADLNCILAMSVLAV